MSSRSSSSRAAVVTGASRGIGRAIAIELARRGYGVGLQARSEGALVELQRAIEEAGGRAIAVPGDVTRAEAARELIDRTEAAFGEVGVAVANAGQALSAPLLKTTESDLRGVLEVNVVSVFHLLQAAGRRMVEKKTPGRLVVIGSTASLSGAKYTSAYSASKHAVLGIVRSAALELAAHGITVNAVCPGWVETDMFEATTRNISEKTGMSEAEARQQITKRIPAGAVVKPEEVAEMVAYVASEAAAKVTGQALVIDGGELL